jgi:hypothetical protein
MMESLAVSAQTASPVAMNELGAVLVFRSS